MGVSEGVGGAEEETGEVQRKASEGRSSSSRAGSNPLANAFLWRKGFELDASINEGQDYQRYGGWIEKE